TERRLIEEYRASIDQALAGLTRDNLPLVLDLATLPEHIRGYGHVKEEHLAKVRARWSEIEAQLAGRPEAPRQVA
ncbi:MAG TPA: DUF6537 domain-containing protein, partial [Burkholderiales bacterium]|nr:DUF6537 domain-containing protein [Burkholderiales bacterium]